MQFSPLVGEIVIMKARPISYIIGIVVHFLEICLCLTLFSLSNNPVGDEGAVIISKNLQRKLKLEALR